jgi:hypothetical protein
MGKKGPATARADGVFIVGENGSSRTVDRGAATFGSGAGANGAATLVRVFVVTLVAARLSTTEAARRIYSTLVTCPEVSKFVTVNRVFVRSFVVRQR